jgi:ATP-dependent Lon protease
MKLKEKIQAWPANRKKNEYPLVSLKELVVFPQMVTPFFVGRDKTIRAIEEAMTTDRKVFLACQKYSIEDPGENDIYQYGVIANVIQMLKLPDNTLRVLVEGIERGYIQRYVATSPTFRIKAATIPDSKEIDSKISALMKTLQQSFRTYCQYNKKISNESINLIEKAEFPDKLVNLICAQVPFKTEKKVELLKNSDTYNRLEALAVMLESENEVASIQDKINSKVKKRFEKSQKE